MTTTTTPARWQEVRSLFDDIVELEASRRTERLAAIAGVDPALRDAVELLLAGDAEAESRLARIDGALAPWRAMSPSRETRDVDPLGLTGRTVSHFRVIESIAVGGMGVVYRAEDTRLGRLVALKLPLPERCVGRDARARFIREGRAAGALDHPNVCGIHEVGESEEGYLFMAMSLYAGETLAARLAHEGSLPVAQALAIARAIARGLAAAHAAGIVHRDLKPANVMLLPDGGVKLLDFGLAKARDVSLTAPYATMGTVSYMAPEQIRGAPADLGADLWALGVVLYEMLTGRRPFAGEEAIAIAHAIVHDEPARPRDLRAEIPSAVERIVRALLAKESAQRPSSAVAVEAGLAAALLGRAPRASWRIGRRWARPKIGVVGVVAAGVLVAAAADVAARRPRRGDTARAASERPAKLPTSNAEAYDYYLRAREYDQSRPNDVSASVAAQSLYRRAIALDSTFALAHARLAMTLAGTPAPVESVSARVAQIRAEADVALRLQPGLGDGHLALGQALTIAGRPDEALAEYRLAAETMTGGEPDQVIGIRLRAKGQWAEALAHLERSTRLDARNIDALRTLAATEVALRRYDAAVRTWGRVMELVPDDHDARVMRATVYLQWLGVADSLAVALREVPPEWDPDGTTTWRRFTVARVERRPRDALAALAASRQDVSRDAFFYRPRSLLLAQAYDAIGDRRRARANYQAARAQLEQSLEANPTSAPMHVALGLSYAGLGLRTAALAEGKRAVALKPLPSAGTGGSVLSATAAMSGAAEVFAHAGDVDGALALLEQLLAMPAGREMSVPMLRVDPAWDPLRDDARFAQLLQRHAQR